MTYEQGGGSGVGIAIKRDDGTTHSFRQRAHGHFTTSMATLKTTAERRQERLEDFLAFFRHALDLGDGQVKAYALVPGADPFNADQLADLLIRQDIEVIYQTAGAMPVSIFDTQVAAGLLGLTLLLAAFTAIGLYMSALTDQPTIAAISTFGLLLLLWIIDWAGNSEAQVSGLFAYLSMLRHYETLLKGLLHSTDVVYYLLVTVLFLGLSIRRLDADRLQH